MPNKPLGQSSREDVLNPQQAASLLMVAVKLIDKVIIHTMLYGGLRVSELCHMRRDWLNFEENTLTVPMRQFCQCWQCRQRDGVWRPKTKKGAREILIHPALLPVLQEFFTINEAFPLTRQRVWQRIKKLTVKAQILHNIYPHCIRATCATILAHQKISAPALQYVLGWSKLTSAESYVRTDRQLAQKEQREIYTQK